MLPQFQVLEVPAADTLRVSTKRGVAESWKDSAFVQGKVVSVLVLDLSGTPLIPCSEKRATKLLAGGRARVHGVLPFVIRLTDRHASSCTFHLLRLKLDHGSKCTGLALVRESEQVHDTGEVFRSAAVLNLFELIHRGSQISERLSARSAM